MQKCLCFININTCMVRLSCCVFEVVIRLFNRSLRKRPIQKNTRTHSIACIWIQRHSHHCKSILEWNFVQICVQVKCLKHSYARSKEFKYPHLTFDQTNICQSSVTCACPTDYVFIYSSDCNYYQWFSKFLHVPSNIAKKLGRELRQRHVDFKTPFYWTLPCLRDPSMARAHMDNFPYRVLSHSTNTRYNLTHKQYVKQDTKVQQF